MNDSLGPARGIVIAVILGTIFWALLFFVLYFDSFGHSVMSELGRRAVEQGVIR